MWIKFKRNLVLLAVFSCMDAFENSNHHMERENIICMTVRLQQTQWQHLCYTIQDSQRRQNKATSCRDRWSYQFCHNVLSS